jgi:hypothetical protein
MANGSRHSPDISAMHSAFDEAMLQDRRIELANEIENGCDDGA